MAFLHNIAANRELREGDEVKVVFGGPRCGRLGTVVGFDLFSDRPVVVQYDNTKGLLRESFAANEVEVRTCKAPESLEPLPEIRTLLKDSSIRRAIGVCGEMLYVVLESGVQVTLVPKRPTSLRRIYESFPHLSFEDRILEILKASFVTRRPHLVR